MSATQRSRFQYRVTTGRLTLPVCIALSALLWWLHEGPQPLAVAGWGVCLLTTFLLAETDNTQQLIRVRSQMVCSTWLFTAACASALHPAIEVQLPAAALAASHLLLLQCYQRTEPVAQVFHSFLLLSVGSLFFTPMLLLTFPMLCYLWRLMLVRSWRTFWAAMVGLALPYIGVGGWCLVTKDFSWILTQIEPLSRLPQLELTAYEGLPAHALIPYVLLVLLTFMGMLHHLTNSFADKIRVRLMLRVFIFQSFFLLLMPVAWPQSLPTLTAMLLVSGAPLIAHFFSLTNSRATNVLFIITIAILLLVTCLPFVPLLWE